MWSFLVRLGLSGALIYAAVWQESKWAQTGLFGAIVLAFELEAFLTKLHRRSLQLQRDTLDKTLDASDHLLQTVKKHVQSSSHTR